MASRAPVGQEMLHDAHPTHRVGSSRVRTNKKTVMIIIIEPLITWKYHSADFIKGMKSRVWLTMRYPVRKGSVVTMIITKSMAEEFCFTSSRKSRRQRKKRPIPRTIRVKASTYLSDSGSQYHPNMESDSMYTWLVYHTGAMNRQMWKIYRITVYIGCFEKARW